MLYHFVSTLNEQRQGVFFFLPLFFFFKRRNLWALVIREWGIHIRMMDQTQNQTRKQRRWLFVRVCEHMCVKIKEEKGAFGVFSRAPLILVKAFIVSSGRGADESLRRRQEESEAKEKLVSEGRC